MRRTRETSSRDLPGVLAAVLSGAVVVLALAGVRTASADTGVEVMPTGPSLPAVTDAPVRAVALSPGAAPALTWAAPGRPAHLDVSGRGAGRVQLSVPQAPPSTATVEVSGCSSPWQEDGTCSGRSWSVLPPSSVKRLERAVDLGPVVGQVAHLRVTSGLGVTLVLSHAP